MSSSDQGPLVVAVVGQTASGKSDLAIAVAREIGAPLVSADAMQLYRGLDVGTAKTPLSERRGVRHFQIDQLDVSEDASVAAYQKHARADIASIHGPVVVAGGSGLYLRALLEPLEFPGSNPLVRAELNELASQLGSSAMHARLSLADPKAAQQIHPNNVRRIVRALEVIEITGKPFSAQLPAYTDFYPRTLHFGITREEEDLHERIWRRTEMMFASGILEEARALEGLAPTATAAKATGYKEALEVLAGNMGIDQAIQQVALATRQLAARQRKWFRRDPRIKWLDANENPVEQVLSVLSQDNPKALL